MNKRSRKVRGSSRRLVALVLCCVCVLAALPVYALANEAATTPSTEASVQQTAGQAPDTPAQGTDTQSADTAPNPAADVNPSNSTPADETPSNSTPADETPGNSTPADETPGNSTPADETPSGSTLADENPTEGSTQPEASAQRMVTATADGLEFSVTGDLSETTTLRVVKLGSEEEAYIRDTVLQLGDQATGAAYDITLLDNDKEIQPEGEVEVSINGLTSAQGVFHLPHTSAADVVKLVEEVAAGGEKLGKIITRVMKSLVGEDIPTERLTSRLTQGKLEFKTSGFSIYYFVFDKYVDAQDPKDDVNVINGLGKDTKDDHVYMAPGTVTKYNADGNISNLQCPENAPFTVTQQDNRVLIFSAKPDATDSDEEYVVTWKEGNTECQLTIHINGRVALENNLKGQKLYIAVRGDGIYPGEPADNSNSYFGEDVWVGNNNVSGLPKYSYYTNEGTNYVANKFGDTTVFSNDASKYISEDIGKHAAFQQSQNNNPVVGIVGQTGEAIKQFIKNNSIDFDDFLDKIADQGNVLAVGGTQITNDNKVQFELVPYVIKYQGENGPGWHIDCIVKKKDDVTLSYDLNIPEGYTAPKTVYSPTSDTGTSPATFDVKAIKNGAADVGTITVTPTVASGDTTESYEFTFIGWNTQSDGKGDWYWPKDMDGTNKAEEATNAPEEITISENTTLYAMWDTDHQLGKGHLRIAKVVSGTATEQEFEFQVSISFPEDFTDTEDTQYTYTVYNSTSTSVSTGRIKSGGTLQLAAGQYAVIKNLPSEATVTITETDAGNYTPSWTGGEAAEGGGTSVTIQGGRTSQVTCTNTRTATLTIKKQISGNMLSQNDSFSFTVSGTSVAEADKTFSLKGGEEKEITVNVGDVITITEDKGQYSTTYQIDTATAENGGTATITPSGDVTITFTNTYSVNIDTGVLLDTLPYLLILALVAGGVVVMLGRRRRRYED